MMVLSNGQERTLRQIREIMEKSGWKLVKVHRSANGAWGAQKVIGVPA